MNYFQFFLGLRIASQGCTPQERRGYKEGGVSIQIPLGDVSLQNL